MKLLALYNNLSEQEILINFDETFRDTYPLSILPSSEYHSDLDKSFQGILCFKDITSQLPVLNLSHLELFNFNNEKQDISSIFKIAKAIHSFTMKIQYQTLNYFPYFACLTDQNGERLVTNNKPTDPFDLEETPQQNLPKWILEQLKAEPDTAFHTTIPSLSLNQILIQTYQPIQDENGQLAGILEYVQDIKPLLKNYLEESGQALVGWSDVTSGASIHNDTLAD